MYKASTNKNMFIVITQVLCTRFNDWLSSSKIIHKQLHTEITFPKISWQIDIFEAFRNEKLILPCVLYTSFHASKTHETIWGAMLNSLRWITPRTVCTRIFKNKFKNTFKLMRQFNTALRSFQIHQDSLCCHILKTSFCGCSRESRTVDVARSLFSTASDQKLLYMFFFWSGGQISVWVIVVRADILRVHRTHLRIQ